MRTAEQDGDDESSLSKVHTSEDRAKPHERENNVFECMQFCQENNSRTDNYVEPKTVNRNRIASSNSELEQTLLTRV